MAEKEWLLYPSRLPGTAGRGPACPVVWEAGEAIPPADPISLHALEYGMMPAHKTFAAVASYGVEIITTASKMS